ncbi:hypothetical protein C8R45DRAFT_1209761 [Mycena sanguinolenta]|nr:hypothetical protein C8R45DRAFT_1209761 [Mycena sanguinolenta]
MLRSFNVGADELISLIEEECFSASEVYRQQLAQTQSQFNAFRSATYTSFAQNEAMTIHCSQEIDMLVKKVREYEEMQLTLLRAGIYYSYGQLAFGGPWGQIVSGLSSCSSNLPHGPFLFPVQVLHALADQGQAEKSRRSEIARLDDLVRWYQAQISPDLNTNSAPSVVGTKREIGTPVLDPIMISKRPRLDVPVQPCRTMPAMPRLSVPFSPVFAPIPTFSPIDAVGGGPSSPHSTMPNATGIQIPKVIDRWNRALAEPVASKPLREFVLPPLTAFEDAHSCTYYLWFSIRMSLYNRMGDSKPTGARAASTTEQWELKLYNDRKGTRNFSFSPMVFDSNASGVSCACGIPPLLPSISHKIPHRADGTPIQSTDFDSPVLRAFILADLELAHAKLQFEQTDDILLDVQSWSTLRWVRRLQARSTIFRNGWDPSFAAVPLEMPGLMARQPWIVAFHDLLVSWPKFESIGPLPVLEIGAEATSGYLEALASFEQRMIAFYLETVSKTLGTCPARPRIRPEVGFLPELYLNIL